MIAYALNAKVYAGPQKEIGWSTLLLNETEDNPLAPLANTPVLHWHGDTFDLPAGATLLASSTLYKDQAFSSAKIFWRYSFIWKLPEILLSLGWWDIPVS